ncbi:NAD-dependent epimerase/dehydratase family protein [Fastidiosipila sanguinis]|uniref:Protein CapI n=1 Tax=Fastidiosipila sanguinis TaxID=236753 RepID=A0A2S0KLD3_9FIRM|nr:NAD-dependent epimerase/dehydratase family protein [Fastidiosipila sanguinis]AVM41843.1 protein CapI [Fastidiosipila sanguinis]
MKDIKHDLSQSRLLVTGGAGFIGSNLAVKLLNDYPGIKILAIDNLNDYYDTSLKDYRLSKLEGNKDFQFKKVDIADREALNEVFTSFKPSLVFNSAAQAGVRYSIDNPDAYVESNLIGFYNILEACRHSYENYEGGVKHLVYASSSSVYGDSNKVPYSVDDKVDNPVSLYAATKKSNELLAHAYSKLYGIPSTGLRFFTVYGPAGRPDMAYFSFTNKLLNGEKIKIFNYGNCRRDFTYIDDIVLGVEKVLQSDPNLTEDGVKYDIYNIGNGEPVNLMDFVKILGEELVSAGLLKEDFDLEANMDLIAAQPGDVVTTYADVSKLKEDFNYEPNTDFRDGIRKFVEWYKEFYLSEDK